MLTPEEFYSACDAGGWDRGCRAVEAVGREGGSRVNSAPGECFAPGRTHSYPTPLSFRVNPYWKQQKNTFAALEMEIPIVTARLLEGVCRHVL